MEAGLTEVTGVPNAFNSHRVMVAPESVAQAEDLLASLDDLELVAEGDGARTEDDDPPTALSLLRQRWLVAGFAIVLLFLIVFLGVGF
jgi:hypothetical protein